MKHRHILLCFVVLLWLTSGVKINANGRDNAPQNLRVLMANLQNKYGFTFALKPTEKMKREGIETKEWNLPDLLSIYGIATQLNTRRRGQVIFYKVANELQNLITKFDDNIYLISARAFAYDFIPTFDNTKGEGMVFYTNELFKRYIELFHNDLEELRRIIKTRYGIIAINPVKEPDLIKKALAAGTKPVDYQNFSNEELIWFISVFEDMPKSVREIKQLKYLSRLKSGEFLPSGAPAISYPTLGFIAFADNMFNIKQKYYAEWLIAHEIGHFFWRFKLGFDERLSWANISKWYPAQKPELIKNKSRELQLMLEDNSTTLEHLRFTEKDFLQRELNKRQLLWSHELDNNFVSEYAASINPGEDFCESFASFIVNSNLLKNTSMEKYNFIKHRFSSYEYIMEVGSRYRFYIYQKNPDLMPPIVDAKDISYSATKLENGDLEYTIKVKVLDDLSGVRYSLFAFTSPNIDNPQEYMLYLYPNKDGFVEGKIRVCRFSQRGSYYISRFVVTDNAGNETYVAYNKERIRIKVDTLTDGYPKPSADISRLKFSTRYITSQEGLYTVLDASVPALTSQNMDLTACLRVVSKTGRQYVDTYGNYDKKSKMVKFEVSLQPMSEMGYWSISSITLTDEARSSIYYNLEKFNYKFYVRSKLSDTDGPELKLDSLTIKVYEDDPVNHDSFNDVVFTFEVKDNLSGFSHAYITIRKPSGKTEGYYFYTDYYNQKLRYDPAHNKWHKYTHTIRFPRHSEQGWYELVSLVLTDKVGNKREYDFTVRMIKQRFKLGGN